MTRPVNPYLHKELPQIVYTEKKQQRYQDNYYAKLSPKTERIRQKLEKRLLQIDKLMTQERLEQAKEKIHHWIHRHSALRTPIEKDTMHLFTEGKCAAPISKKLYEIRKRIEASFYEPIATSDLKGRVTKRS